jgi:hypothetical protein
MMSRTKVYLEYTVFHDDEHGHSPSWRAHCPRRNSSGTTGSTHMGIWKGLRLFLAFIWSAMSSGVMGSGVWAWRYHNEVTKDSLVVYDKTTR